MYSLLITATQLQALMASSVRCLVFDARFDLAQPDAGEAAYQAAHIPMAHYVHLDRDLSEKDPNAPRLCGGRHPLPTPERFQLWMQQYAITPDTQVVVYDQDQPMFAPRLWWMLKKMGHEAVAVLDGGFQAWLHAWMVKEMEQDGGFQAWLHENQIPSPTTPTPTPTPTPTLPITPISTPWCRWHDLLPDVQAQLQNAHHQPKYLIIDARTPARYRGDIEPLDPVAGHIPNAINRPITDNVDSNGYFKSPSQLRQEWQALLQPHGWQEGQTSPILVHQCGSGVTACVNLLAMELANLGRHTLYAGSWSEWCRLDGSPPLSTP